MKKIVAMILACAMAFSLVACGGNSKADWTAEDMVFTGASEEQEVKVDHAIIVYEDVTYYTSYADGSYDEFAEEFVAGRGLELGMTMDDYKELYNVKPGYAVWELYSGDNNEWTSFAAYSNQEPSEMYDEYNNAWLDIGYTKVDGKWEQMKDFDVQDTWFCEADFDAFEEVVIFAVNFDDFGKITGISLEHFTYDDAWVEWQAWE